SSSSVRYARRRRVRMLASMGIVARSFEEPDELVTLPLVDVQVVVLGEVYVARTVHQPGWSWSEHVRPVAGTATCQHHHQGIVVSGQVEIEMEGGARRILREGEAFDIPPGHDSRVVGGEPCGSGTPSGRSCCRAMETVCGVSSTASAAWK